MKVVYMLMAIGAATFSLVYGARVLFGYHLTRTQIQLRLLHILPLYWVNLSDIEVIRVCRSSEWPPDFTTLRLGNRMTRQGVVIEKKRGFFRRIVLSPGDCAAFVIKVEGALGRRDSERTS
jgi:hypothetical protein